MAQIPYAHCGIQDSIPRWEPHLSVSTGFVGTSWGDNRLYTSVAPSLIYRPSNRWSFDAGFRITTDMGLGTLPASVGENTTSSTRSLAPYRNGGTGLASAHVEAVYQANDNLWLSAALYHMGGNYSPLYSPFGGQSFDVSITALSAAAAFRFANDSWLNLSFTLVRDQAGTLPLLYHDAWMYSGYRLYNPWGGYGFSSLGGLIGYDSFCSYGLYGLW